MPTRYVVITGGVISGVGKGTITASLGMLLKSQGFKVTSVKIDPYINIDAGTMRPTEHGEVFVTDDGGETDQDIGTYERFLDCSLSRKENITTGQVYESVIHKERNLEYSGKCVEVIPHIPHEIQQRIKDSAKRANADFCTIEIGGTVGDYQNVLFLEALREMKLKGADVVFVHVSYLPIPGNLGEMKTKPTQRSVRDLNSIGIQPDFIVARAAKPLDEPRKEKLSLFCNVSPDHVISAPDVSNIYDVPALLDKQSICHKILSKFGLPYTEEAINPWIEFMQRIKDLGRSVSIGIVGKYFDVGDFTLEDSYISVLEAIKHACWHNSVKPSIQWIDSKKFETDPPSLSQLDDYGCIIVPGGFGKSGVEGKISALRYCREKKIPALGLCLGLQLMVVEYARNVCGIAGATSAEFDDKSSHKVIDLMPEQKKAMAESLYGATMRLGAYEAALKKGSIVHSLYGADNVSERHRHRYEVNPEYIERIEKAGLSFSGKSPDGRLMEFVELPGHPFYAATQAHPEFKSRPLKPSPLFNGLIKAAISRKI